MQSGAIEKTDIYIVYAYNEIDGIEYDHVSIYFTLDHEKAKEVRDYCVKNKEKVNDLQIFDKFCVYKSKTETVYGIKIPELMDNKCNKQ